MARPSLKETVGTSVNAGNLASNNRKEMPVDRVAAMARADHLGSALWRLKVGGDMTVLKRAAALLAYRARAEGMVAADWAMKRTRRGPPLLIRICERIINEWLQDKCPRCKGRGRTGMGKGGVVVATEDCATCRGSGRVQHVGKISAALLERGEAAYTKHYRWRGQVRTKPAVITMPKEGVTPAMIPCADCGGRGRVPLDKTVKKASLGKVCRSCQGTGWARINGAERARIVGVSPKNYWKTWDDRFKKIRQLVVEADRTAAEDVRTALRGPRK